MMSRKDYIAAAKLIGQMESKTYRRISKEVFVRFFSDDNPRFDERTFLARIEVETARHIADKVGSQSPDGDADGGEFWRKL